MTEAVYHRLMRAGEGLGEYFDRHVFACTIAVCRGDPAQDQGPLTHALGLSPDALTHLFETYFPTALDCLFPLGKEAGEDALEEPDLRSLIRAHGATGRIEETWLAALIARRCQQPNHLWQDLGLTGRGDLSTLIRRNFPGLVALNAADMKWKKFFYRQLCQSEGVVICKSPVCSACEDFVQCFGQEEGASLLFSAAPAPLVPSAV